MSDWIKHDGGPQPVADDVWVDNDFDDDPEEQVTTAFLSQWVRWEPRQVYRVLNQHLIDAARLEGIRLGLDAAFRVLITQFLSQERGPPEWHMLGTAISTLDPATIAREAVLDKLASEAQEQGMGYEKEADQ